MKVLTNEKTGTNTVELELEVSAEELDEAVKKVFDKQSKNITVPGFRKGKAPRKIIEKMYGEGVFLEDAVNELYPTAFSDAVKETGIEPVAPAEVEIIDLDAKKGFTFRAIVTVKPEVKLGKYNGLEVEKVVRKISDEDVDGEIERLRERGARVVNVDDRPAQDGDTAVIDFEGFVDGVAFEGGQGVDFDLVLGSHSFIDTFEDQIIGHSIDDEFDVNVTFPEEYHAEELKGKPAVFKVTLKALKEKQLPEVDDEFAKDVSEYDTLAELKAHTKESMQEHADGHADEDVDNKLMDMVADSLEAEIPEAMYEVRIDELVRSFSQQLQAQGLNLDMYLQYSGADMPTFRAGFQEQAERQVKIRLALEQIAKEQDIQVSDEELLEEIEKMAKAYNMKVEQLKSLIPAGDLEGDLKNGKAIDYVREHAVIKEVEKASDTKDAE